MTAGAAPGAASGGPPGTTDKILLRKDGRVGHLVFNNPERHNAVSLEMWDRVAEGLEDFGADDGIRVVVLSGAGGKAFVSGADISKFETERGSRQAVGAYNARIKEVYQGIQGFPKPTIAMIDGYCLGGGLALAVSCDLRFCSTKSKFGLPAARLGLGYPFHGLKRLVDTIGPGAWTRTKHGSSGWCRRSCPRPSSPPSSTTTPPPSRTTRR